MAGRKTVRLFAGYTKPGQLIKRIMKEFGKEISLSTACRNPVDMIVRYCCGEKISLSALPMDWSSLTDFQQRVLGAAIQIPYGSVDTYGGLAKRIGAPNSSRAVGNALAKNPFPLLVPCHRIVRANGKIGGFSGGGGMGLKKRLLKIEGFQEKRRAAKREKTV